MEENQEGTQNEFQAELQAQLDAENEQAASDLAYEEMVAESQKEAQ